MSIGDKIIRLRRCRGWSQEEFAEKLCVSRQAVSKWESGQSNPELEKIIMMSEMFGVTTDYLLKDSIDGDEVGDMHGEISAQAKSGSLTDDGAQKKIRRVTAEDADGYIKLRAGAAHLIAFATVLCILSPIALILLAEISERGAVSESLACGVGLAVLFLLIMTAVPMYIYCGFKKSQYEYLENMAEFELTDDTKEYVCGGIDSQSREYMALNIAGTCVCIISPVPLIISSFWGNELLVVCMLCVLLALVAIGVYMFIYAGVRHASYELLLKKGEPSPSEKGSGVIMTVYWSLIGATYLLWSFLSEDWHITWLVFVVGGALCPAVSAIANARSGRDK